MGKRNHLENLIRTFLLLSIVILISLFTACAGGEGVVSPEGASVVPSSFPEATPTLLTITGAEFLPGAQVFWNGKAVPTNYVSPTQLTVSINQPTPGKFPITVTNPTPRSLPTAQLFAQVMPGDDVVEIQRVNGASVRVNDTLKFSTTVTGTLNTGVTWQLNGTSAGNSQIGTFVVNAGGSVTYTAPAVVPTPNTITLTATSVDNPADNDNRLIEILNPIPTLTSVTPSTTNPGTVNFVLTGSSFVSGAQLLVNGSPTTVSFQNSGQLTASVNLPIPGTYYFQVVNPVSGFCGDRAAPHYGPRYSAHPSRNSGSGVEVSRSSYVWGDLGGYSESLDNRLSGVVQPTVQCAAGLACSLYRSGTAKRFGPSHFSGNVCRTGGGELRSDGSTLQLLPLSVRERKYQRRHLAEFLYAGGQRTRPASSARSVLAEPVPRDLQ